MPIFARAQQPIAVLRQAAHGFHADLHGPDGFLPRHRGALRHVVRALPDLPVDDAGEGDIAVDAQIDDPKVGAAEPGQHADSRDSFDEVHGLRHRDDLRTGANAFFVDAVVGRHDDDAFPSDFVLHFAGDAGDLYRNVLERPEAADGLGEAVLPLGAAHHGGPIRTVNALYYASVQFHALSPIESGFRRRGYSGRSMNTIMSAENQLPAGADPSEEKAFRAATIVASISASPWARDMKPASNCEGAR